MRKIKKHRRKCIIVNYKVYDRKTREKLLDNGKKIKGGYIIIPFRKFQKIVYDEK